MKKDIAEKMERRLKDLPEPGQASGNQHYNIVMFKMSVLMFMATETIRNLTWALAALTLVMAVLTVLMVVAQFRATG